MTRMKRILAVMLALCLLCSVAPMTVFAALVAENGVIKIDAANFFEAYNSSTDDGVEILGITADENGNAYIITYSRQNTYKSFDNAKLTYPDGKVYTVLYNDNNMTLINSDGSEEVVPYSDDYVKPELLQATRLNIQLPSKLLKFVPGAKSFAIFPIGSVDRVSTSFALTLDAPVNEPVFYELDTGTEADVDVDVDLNYKITNEFDASNATKNGTLKFNITIENTGDYPISGINVYDTVPDGFKVYGNGIYSYDDDGRLILDKNVTLNVGQSKRYVVTFQVIDKSTNHSVRVDGISSKAVIESNVLPPMEATAIVHPGYAVIKTIFEENGSMIKYRVVVHNNGDCPLSDVSVYDEVPDELNIIDVARSEDLDGKKTTSMYMAYDAEGRLILDENFTLEVGGSRYYFITAEIKVDDTDNKLTADAWIANFAIAESSILMTERSIAVLHPRYEIAKTVSKENVDPGEEIVYTITAVNSGNYTITDITVKDDVPTGITITGILEPGYLPEDYNQGDDITLATGLTLAPGESKTFDIYATVDDLPSYTRIINTASMNCKVLESVSAKAVITINPHFHVYHSAANDGEKLEIVVFTDELLDGGKFDITCPGSAGTTYVGLTNSTLYGGTFTSKEFDEAYKFDKGESGIGFTPEFDKTYYVWEPSNAYLRPRTLSVWKPVYVASTNSMANDVTNLYLLTAIDRLLYSHVGFEVEGTSIVADAQNTLNGEIAYNTVITENDNKAHSSNSIYNLNGYLSCFELKEFKQTYGINNPFKILPYWVTLDGVKVSGTTQRNVMYVGPKNDNTGKSVQPASLLDVEIGSQINTYSQPSYSALRLLDAFTAVGTDETTPDETTPDKSTPDKTTPIKPTTDKTTPNKPTSNAVTVDYSCVTIGKTTKVKELVLTFNIKGVSYKEVGFVINGKTIVAKADKNGVVTLGYSLTGLKNNTQIQITPYWVTKNGSTMYGTTRTLSYSNHVILNKERSL